MAAVLGAMSAGCASAAGSTAGGPAPFRPAWWCRGPNAQTIAASVLRPVRAVPLHRERWETTDGDFIDVDRLSGAPGTPVVIILHGLTGSSRSKHVLGLLAAAERRGWRGIGVNFRSSSGEPNRLRRSYHAGETTDLDWVVRRAAAEDPTGPILCAGFSLGGNVLLKYLGEQGEALHPLVRAAAAVSTPFNLAESVRALERGFARFYMNQLVRNLKARARAKMKAYPDLVDREALEAVRTVAEFDEAVTAPVYGFRSAAEYWSASSSAGFLRGIRRPTLLINARDDPFLPEACLPVSAVAANPSLTAEFTPKGGHIGFLAGPWPGRAVCWSEERVLRFFEQELRER